MRSVKVGVLVAVAILLVGGGALLAARGGGSDDDSDGNGDAVTAGDLTVTDAWSGPNQGVTAVYLTIENDGADDRLVGVSTDSGAGASIMGGDDTGSHDAEGAVPVDLPVPSGTTELQPGGAQHLMLEGMAEPLEPGASFTLNLQFEKAGSVDVPVEVVSWDEAADRAG